MSTLYYNTPHVISGVKTEVQGQNPGSTNTEVSVKGDKPGGE